MAERLQVAFEARNLLSPEIAKVRKNFSNLDRQLDQTNARFRQFEASTARTGRAFRDIRPAFQNASFQIQDIAVQLSAGTAGAVVLAQQLPQLVSGFGAVGAAIGAVVAIGAGLFVAFGDTLFSVKSLSASSQELAKVLEGLKSSVASAELSLSDLQKRFGAAGDSVRESFIKVLEIDLIVAQRKLDESVSEINSNFTTLTGSVGEFADNLLLLLPILAPTKVALDGLALSNLADKFDLSFENAKKFRLALLELGRASGDDVGPAIDKFVETSEELGIVFEDLPEQVFDVIQSFLKNKITVQQLTEAIRRAKENLDGYKNGLKEFILTAEQVEDRLAALRLLKAQRRADQLDEENKERKKKEEEIAEDLLELEKLRAQRRAEANDAAFKAELKARKEFAREARRLAEKEAREADRVLERLKDQAKAFREAENPAIAFENRLREISILIKESPEDYKALRKEALKTFKDAKDEADGFKEAGEELATSLERSFASSFKAFVTGSKSAGEAFTDFAATIIEGILDIAIQQAILQPIGNALGGGGGGLGGIFGSIIGSLFGGGFQPAGVSGSAATPGQYAFPSGAGIGYRARGGPVTGGQSYVVGEEGPELFTAPKSGRIVPNNQMGGGGGVIINQSLNFSLGVQQTVRAEVNNLMPTIVNSTKSAIADARQRGGGFSKAMGR